MYFDGWQVNARKYVHTDFLFDIGYTSGPFLLYCRNIPLPIFILDIAVNWILVLLSIRNSYLSFWHRSIKRYLCSSEKVDRKGYGTPLFDNKSVDEAHKTKNHSTEAYPKQSLLVHRTKQLSPWANPRSKSKKSSSSRSKLFTGVGLDRIWSCSVAATDFFCPTVSKSSNKFSLNICFCKLLQKGPKEGWQASCSNPLPWFPWVEIHGSFTKDTLSYPFEQAMILKWNHQLTLSLRYLSFIQEVTRKKLPRSTNKSFRSRKRLARPPGSEAGGDSCFPRAHQALLPA